MAKRTTPLTYEKMLKKAKKKWMVAKIAYDTLRNQCKHERKVYKSKYGGYLCEVCERFLPRS